MTRCKGREPYQGLCQRELLVAVCRLNVHQGLRDAGRILMIARDRARQKAIENSPSWVMAAWPSLSPEQLFCSSSRPRCFVQSRSVFRTCSLKLLGTPSRLDAERANSIHER